MPKPVLAAAKLMYGGAALSAAYLIAMVSRGIVQMFAVALTWLIGLAAVWLLWRPASSAFFKAQRFA